jgi:hypothetical protein
MRDRIDANRDIFLRFAEEQRSKTIVSTVVAGARGIWDSGAQMWDAGAKIWDSGAVALTAESACRCLERSKESLERQ